MKGQKPMLTLNKKQVKGILKVITSEPCKTRPALMTMRIKRDGFAYITNGYVAIRWKLELEPVPKFDEQEEFIITAENLEKWYKLANSKDKLDGLSILELQDVENTTIYPNMAQLFDKYCQMKPSSKPFFVDEELIRLFTDVAGDACIRVQALNGCLYVNSLVESSIDCIIMGLNK